VLVVLPSRVVAQRTPLQDVLDRAALYVLKYEKECSAVVAEERYRQDLEWPSPKKQGRRLGDAQRADDKRLWDDAPTRSRIKGYTGPTHRELLSDVLMVQLPDQTWVGFRDVAEVDGSAVRDRSDRLQTLFLKSSADLRRVQEESARFNIGPVRRTMNLPTFALAYLHPSLRHRFAFQAAGEEAVDGTHTAVVAFVEQSRPTIITDGRGGSIVSRGRFWIEPDTGRVRRTLLLAGDGGSDVHAESDVIYRPHQEWGLLLPAEMREAYEQPTRPEEMRVVCRASYANFRRFQVTADVQKRP
jgi:hypothetical protein